MQEQLPIMVPGQRLRIEFSEPYRNYLVQMELYPEGTQLVYQFERLGWDPKRVGDRDTPPVNEAFLEAQPGQRIEVAPDFAILWDPLKSEVLAAAQAKQEKLDLITEALDKQILAQKEGDALKELVERKPGIPIERWRGYLNRHETLSRALKENLIDEGLYQSRLTLLEAELRGR